MTNRLFGSSDKPRIPKRIVLEGKLKLNFNLELKKFPDRQILSAFKEGVNDATRRVVIDLKAALDEAMRSNTWRVPSGTGDIIDSGALLESGEVRAGPDGVEISYSAPYAALVHYGGYIFPYGNQSTRVYLPPRPWVDAVLRGDGPVKGFDLEKYYREEIARRFQ